MSASELSARLGALEAALDTIDGRMAPVLAALADPARATAGLQLTAGYSLLSLFFMFARSQGMNVEDSPVKRELERMKGYFQKMKASAQRKSRKRAREEASASTTGAGQSVEAMSAAASAWLDELRSDMMNIRSPNPAT